MSLAYILCKNKIFVSAGDGGLGKQNKRSSPKVLTEKGYERVQKKQKAPKKNSHDPCSQSYLYRDKQKNRSYFPSYAQGFPRFAQKKQTTRATQKDGALKAFAAGVYNWSRLQVESSLPPHLYNTWPTAAPHWPLHNALMTPVSVKLWQFYIERRKMFGELQRVRCIAV